MNVMWGGKPGRCTTCRRTIAKGEVRWGASRGGVVCRGCADTVLKAQEACSCVFDGGRFHAVRAKHYERRMVETLRRRR